MEKKALVSYPFEGILCKKSLFLVIFYVFERGKGACLCFEKSG